MFVMTAKLDKKKLLIGALLLGVVVLGLILVLSSGSNSRSTALRSPAVKDNEDRVEFLEDCGWQVDPDPIEVQTIVIPRSFDGVYQKYNALQTEQGYDLAEYAGLEAVRYTYRVLNYPGIKDGIVADIVVYRNRVIAGDVQNIALDGFMQGLAFPAA